MKREELKSLGLDDTAIDAVMALHGKDIEAHKTQVSTSKAQIDTLTEQVSTANAQIESFKALDIDGVKKAADEWKTKAEQAEQNAAQQIAQMKYDNDLQDAMKSQKVKYQNEVLARLNKDELKDKNGAFISERFKEQLEKIKTEDVSLFESDKQIPQIVTGGNNQSILGDSTISAMRKAAGLPDAQ